MKIKIIKPGLFTTIQDIGRFGFEAYGIPQSGYLDTISAQNANKLVGNPIEGALLEATGTGPTIEFDSNSQIAICGASMSPTLNNKPISNDSAIEIKKGDKLSFGALKLGYRAYIAIQGGLNINEVYGSKSTYTLASFGGHNGRLLQKEDVIKVSKRPRVLNTNHKQDKINISSKAIIQITPGPEIGLFTFKELSAFMSAIFTVSKDSNRMGIRLEGNWLDKKSLNTIISSGNIPGVIQITPSLQPIILLNDAGTTGGYPRIGVCTLKSISRLAQLKPGDTLEFSF